MNWRLGDFYLERFRNKERKQKNDEKENFHFFFEENIFFPKNYLKILAIFFPFDKSYKGCMNSCQLLNYQDIFYKYYTKYSPSLSTISYIFTNLDSCFFLQSIFSPIFPSPLAILHQQYYNTHFQSTLPFPI